MSSEKDIITNALFKAVPFNDDETVKEWQLNIEDVDHSILHRTMSPLDYLKELQNQYYQYIINPQYTLHCCDAKAVPEKTDYWEKDMEFETNNPFHLVCFTYSGRGLDSSEESNEMDTPRIYLERTEACEDKKFLSSLRIKFI